MAIFQQPFLTGGFPSMNRAAAGPVGGWVELGRTTLGADGDDITVSSLADKRYYMILGNNLNSTGNNGMQFRCGNSTIDTGSNYANRESANGGADATQTSTTVLQGSTDSTQGQGLTVGYIANLSANEKLWNYHTVNWGASGAATAPNREEGVGKWTNTSNVIDIFQGKNLDTGDLITGSEVVVLGWDPDDTHTTNFWEELASVELGSTNSTLSTGTFTAKKYLWVQMWHGGASGTADAYFRVGNSTADSGSNYASRFSVNGAADGTQTSTNRAEAVFMNDTTPEFVNIFIINNASNEKLGIAHTTSQSTAGAANAPARQEGVFKWDNTSNQINIIEWQKQSSQTFPAGTIVKVWGAD